MLNEIIRDGTFFSNCISTAPYTSASHASFFTGKWPLKHGVFEFFNRRLTCQTIFTFAKRIGYETLFKTDFPIILGSFLGFDRDVDQYIIEDDEAFLGALEQSQKRLQHTFSFVHFGGLHIPYGFHNLRYGGQHYWKKVEELEGEISGLDDSFTDRLVETYRTEEDLNLLMRYKRVIQHHYFYSHYDKLFSLYLEGVNFFFASRFESFFQKLREILGKQSFLVIIFGDHGEEYDSSSYGHFNTLAEGVLRVPVIFYGTDIPTNFHTKRIRSIDIAPTLLDLLKFPSGKRGMDGISLIKTLREGKTYPERMAIAQAYTSDPREFVAYQQRLLASGKKTGALRHVRYKEIVYEGSCKLMRQNYQYGEQFDLKPCQPRVLLEQLDSDGHWIQFKNIDVENQLLAILDAYNLTHKGGQTTKDIPEEVRQQLLRMGYKV